MSFKDFKSILGDLIQSRPGWKRHMNLAVIWESWDEIVGKDVSRNAFPEKVVETNVLVVRVPDSIWMQQLFLERYNILTRINSYLPHGSKLKEIRFRLGDARDIPRMPNRTRRSMTAPPRPMTSKDAPRELLKQAKALTSCVKDSALKERLMSAYVAFKLKKAKIKGQQ